ncbi:hypothetical protein [Desulfobacula toluolica]|uniref:Conserved uncharacterized protein n=1 Tax=Desulfobacula toluolica (strain DSM 7467 / Tol2) TaxID=651182 RepID=K0NGC5_DESTT|nr:hypothetical protein [Desulfobacula toluolica]CCK78868.1 conserved uncharacterized protein [Desulfobacula toluolica Tol2]
MKNFKEENSTQKLLNLIRTGGKDHVDDAVSGDSVSDNSGLSLPVTIKDKHLNAGVWITHRDITLVMTSDKAGAGKKVLVKWQHILLPANLQPDSNDFPAFLGTCLDTFLEDKKKISIWCALDSSRLNIRNITIPDVPHPKIANAAFWGLKKETDFNENREIFDFEILGDITINGIKKKNLLVFSVPTDQVRSLEKIFERAGYGLAGVTSTPFAVQNFIRNGQIRVDAPYFSIVNISRENSDIYCFSLSGILLVRTLRTGSWNLLDELDTSMKKDPIDYLSSLTKTDADQFPRIKENSERLISKIIRTGDYCTHHYTDNTPMQRYVFYGETDYCDLFMHQASTMIPAAVDILEPVRAGFPGSNESGLPKTAQQRNSVLTAFGIALSDNDITPNFMFTFDDRQRAKKQKKITLATVIAGIILLAVSFSAYFLLNFTYEKKLSTLVQLNREQAKFKNNIQTKTITDAIINAEKKEISKTQYIDTYLPLAVIYDICHFTPDHIHLTSMVYDRIKDKKKPDMIFRKLSIEGWVSAHKHVLNFELGSYILKLSESPVFGDIEITDKWTNQNNNSKSLFFKVRLEVL